MKQRRVFPNPLPNNRNSVYEQHHIVAMMAVIGIHAKLVHNFERVLALGQRVEPFNVSAMLPFDK
jgi:hypothetical protein